MAPEVNERFVLDCSLTMAWYFPDEATPYANAVHRGLKTREAIVPALWRLEVANVLIVSERRQRSTGAQSAPFLAMLQQLPIRIDDETDNRAWSETLQLARTHQLTSYDAAYLELAMRRGCPLATLDRKLSAVAEAVGVLSFHDSDFKKLVP